MLLDRILLNATESFPDNTALVQGSSRISYSDLYARVVKLASVLQSHGLCRNDRVVIALENSLDYVVSYFGIVLAGGVTVAINPDIKPAGLQKIVLDCTPSGIITRSDLLPVVEACRRDYFLKYILLCDHAEPSRKADTKVLYIDECLECGNGSFCSYDRKEEDLASIIYTSGTTGDPKGVMLSNKNLISNAISIVKYLELTDKDSIMVVLPFYYSYGNSLLLTHIMQGGSLVMDNRFMYPNVVLDSMVGESVTGFAGVPSTFAILLHRSNFRNMSFPSLRYITQAGGPMSHDMAAEIAKIVPQAKVYIMYGQTEASARLSYLPPGDLKRKRSSVGRGIPGVTLEVINKNGEEVKPGEAGEIVAKGDNIMPGYWGKEKETLQVLRDGWLYTGDIATIDEEGYVYILGRRTEMIKSGAHRIAPREIEEIILKHPKIAEGAVIGLPDPILGEAISAFIVIKDGCSCQEKEIMQHCYKNLPLYKMPKAIHFVSSLPKTDSGKIKKEELRKYLTDTR